MNKEAIYKLALKNLAQVNRGLLALNIPAQAQANRVGMQTATQRTLSSSGNLGSLINKGIHRKY